MLNYPGIAIKKALNMESDGLGSISSTTSFVTLNDQF